MGPRLAARRWGVFAALILTMAALATNARSQQSVASRPREVATFEGNVVATNWGSNHISVRFHGASAPQEYFVGSPSWGVCTTDSMAYVTLPGEAHLAIFDFRDSSITHSSSVPIGCTEIISNQAGTRLYLANVGASTEASPENQWQHSIVALDISGGTESSSAFSTERQPRALALSPDESRLIVGTVQGALGQAGLAPNASGPGLRSPHDGGSILVHDLASPSSIVRIGIGSPVRGIAVLPDSVYASAPTGAYRIYATHVGEGVQSEDPRFGGRAIPNVISSIAMSSNHEPIQRQDTVFKHVPQFEDQLVLFPSDLPAVVPDRLAIREVSTRSGYSADLWVTHSGSGTVGRAWIESGTGAIATNDTTSFSLSFPTVASIADTTFGFTISTASIDYERIAPLDLMRTDRMSLEKYRSRPLGIAYDDLTDTMVLCTEFGGQLLTFSAADSSFASMTPDSTAILDLGSPIADYGDSDRGEGNFFTFGEGFDFRESEEGVLPVDNLSCGTCHVDGHLDGKVRLTVRETENISGVQDAQRAVTAVPSVRDAHNSEWIFFEGLKTVVDRREERQLSPVNGCSYCDDVEFFLDTVNFTPRSPASPHQDPAHGVTVDVLRGRAWFDAMNCTRCHSPSDRPFLRTNDTRMDAQDREGPLQFLAGGLSDVTHSFISVEGLGKSNDDASLRNMTNVGTRLPPGGSASINPTAFAHVRGVNTPALAGSWDNRPYLHDGRYRTLDEVLRHTWLERAEGHRAARLWNGPGVPDNLLDREDLPIPSDGSGTLDRIVGTATPDVVFVNALPDVPVKNFRTHQHADPDGPTSEEWTSVRSFLSNRGTAYGDLLAFLLGLSSEFDPFPSGLASVDSLHVDTSTPGEVVVHWSTAELSAPHLTVYNDLGDTVFSDILAPSVSFAQPVTTAVGGRWTATVSTAYAGLRDEATQTWTNTTFTFANRSTDTGYAYGETPYASIALDYDEDANGDMDLLITSASGPVGVMANDENELTPDVPLFVNQVDNALGPAPPEETRGVAAADYDNDGELDLFFSSRSSPRLYRGNGSSFADVSASLSIAFADLADSSWCGAWGDYDRDGDVDLFVGRAGGVGDQPNGALPDRLLRNDGDGTFTDVTAFARLSDATSVTTTTASWSDLTADGSLDLFVGATGPNEASYVLQQVLELDTNDPYAASQLRFEESSSSLPSAPSTLDQIAGATWWDLDNDQDLDLLLSGLSSGENGARVLWNDGQGSLGTTSSVGDGLAAQGHVILDSDLNGHVDLLFAPAPADTLPALLRNEGSGIFTAAPERSEMSTSTPLAFKALAAADFAGANHLPDGDADVYIGRTDSSAVFYQNLPSGTDVPPRKWLKVVLQSDRSNNRFGIGTTVTVTAGPLVQTQIVDGGSGAGSQNNPVLVFGLGDTGHDASVQVTWPDGSQLEQPRTVTNDSLNSTIVIQDDHEPSQRPASIFAIAVAAPGGGTDWIFQWETDHGCAPAQSYVRLKNGRREDPCPNFSSEITLDAGTPDVTVQVFPKPGGGYVHRVIYENQLCGHPCSYQFRVHNDVADTSPPTGEQWSSWQSFSVSACIN